MAKTTDPIVFKLYKEGMVVYINKSISFTEIKKIVTSKFKKSENFFQGLTLRIGFKGVDLDKEQLAELAEAVSETLDCKTVLWENPQPLEATTEEKMKKNLTPEQIVSTAFKIEIDDEKTKFYTKTVRSGQLLESEGNIVIVGDVNPGAELVAEGNIVVMGTVKGRVHAGSKGNRDAIVVAMNLSPIQLRIADLITRSPDEDESHGKVPEIAYIKDDLIFIEDFLQKRK